MTTSHRRIAITLLTTVMLFAPLGLLACGRPQAEVVKEVILATTTSTRDSGLLDALIPVFESSHPYVIKPIAVGTGQALELGKRGEADILLTHAPEAERDLVAQGLIARRRLVMHNDFVVVGPASDPAGLSQATSAGDTFERTANARALWISRGDDSGTHHMEQALWAATAIIPSGQWYRQSGLGMADTLRMASELEGYTLTDRGTYVSLKATLALQILFAGDTALLNLYHVLEVDGARFPKINSQGAAAFADFLLSTVAQDIIGSFGIEQYGSPLFFADGGKTEDDLLSGTP